MLSSMKEDFKRFQDYFNHFDTWLSNSEDKLRLVQRSIGDLSRLQEQTKEQLVSALEIITSI